MSRGGRAVVWVRPEWQEWVVRCLKATGFTLSAQGEGGELWVVEGGAERVLEARRHARAVVAVGEDEDGWRLAIRAGAFDYVRFGDEEDLVAALLRASAEEERPEGAAPRGELVVIFGAKGGVGRTTIVANLAWALADLGETVIALDLDLEQGDLDIWFGGGLREGTHPLRLEAPRDPEALERLLPEVRPGLRVLAAPKDPGEARMVGAEQLSAWLARLVQSARFVVVDTAPGFTNLGLLALKEATRRFVVLTPELPALRATLRALSIFRDRFGWPDASLAVVLNRAGAVGLSSDEVAELLGRPLAETIPSDGSAVVAALNRGRPFVADGGRGPAAQALGRFAAHLVGTDQALRTARPISRRWPWRR